MPGSENASKYDIAGASAGNGVILKTAATPGAYPVPAVAGTDYADPAAVALKAANDTITGGWTINALWGWLRKQTFVTGAETALDLVCSAGAAILCRSSGVSPQVQVGADYISFWRDNTPTKAGVIGTSIPGGSTTDDIVFGTFNGSAWSEQGRVVNGGGFHAPLKDKGGTEFHVEAATYGAVGNGTTDDTNAVNLAMAAASAAGGGIVRLGPKSYSIQGTLSDQYPGVTVRGVHGASRLLGNGSTVNMLYPPGGRECYDGCTFEDLIFDCSFGSVVLNGSKNIMFRRCDFRIEDSNTYLGGASNIRFEDCRFFGTRPGVMQAGVLDPAAVPGANYSLGVVIEGGSSNIAFTGCEFHYCRYALLANGAAGLRINGITVENCRFASDWWDGPYYTAKFSDGVYTNPGGTPTITSASTNFDGAGILTSEGGSENVLTITKIVCSGSGLTSTYINGVVAAADALSGSRPGDVIETSTGLRAEITSVDLDGSNTRVWIKGWQAIDTYEPAAILNVSPNWRVVRRYAASIIGSAGGVVSLYHEPTNPTTGEKAFTGAGMATTGLSGRVQARTIYSGVRALCADNITVHGSDFRGGWGDQISFYGCAGGMVSENHVRYGQDVSITVEGDSKRFTLENNQIEYSGSVGIWLGASNSVASGNLFNSWCLGPGGSGDGWGILILGKGNVVSNSTFTVDQTTNYGGFSSYAIGLQIQDCTGTKICGITSVPGQGPRVGTIYAHAESVPTPGAVVACQVDSVAGPAASYVAILTDMGMRTFAGTAAPVSGGPYVVGDRVLNTAPAASGFTGWVCTVAGSPGTWKGYGAIEP